MCSEAERQAVINGAQGLACANVAQPEASAVALRQVSAALNDPGGIDAVNLSMAELYMDVCGNLVKTSNLLIVPMRQFGNLYHERWRIEETFRRIKYRLNLEHVSGLSQQAALHDFAAKILCDNLQSLATQAALRQMPLPL